MTESALVARLRVAVSLVGGRIFRNNVGMAITKDDRKIRFGLCAGSSDLIGWTPITVTQEMVGREVAVFTAIEAKTKTGRVSAKQKTFIANVLSNGGIALVARNVEDAMWEIMKFRGLSK